MSNLTGQARSSLSSAEDGLVEKPNQVLKQMMMTLTINFNAVVPLTFLTNCRTCSVRKDELVVAPTYT